MRARSMAATTVLALVVSGLVAGMAVADDDTVPSKADVQDARTAVLAQTDGIASVRARLAVANQGLQQSAIVAAQASEAFNGARWRADKARDAAARAQAGVAAAQADAERQRQAYTDTVVTSYELGPGLTGMAALVDADGIGDVLQRATTMRNATDALDDNYDQFRASAVVAEVAQNQADQALADAEQAEQDARDAKAAAQQAADAAAADAQAIADEKTTLITRLADLEHISVDLAQRRQSGLEARAARAAAVAAQQEQEQQQEQAAQPASEPTEQATPSEQPTERPTDEPSTEPTEEPTQAPDPPAASAPAPKSGAQAAIAFARAQIGEPYVWGAAGPSSWDCSGLTSGAWQAGGTYLPHYSVAQYEQSTPISPSQLQPGDLVFWGSSSSPGSIYHVALYAGNGMIIQAPRTGENVEEVSMYYWTTPNFYARP